jgi:ABC-type antimicrobial peptide transport system permease subunit
MASLAKIISFMAGIAVMLAVTGVYGVLSFAVQQRTREFGIRMVLGATRRRVFQSVVGKGLLQITLGLLHGVALATPAAWGAGAPYEEFPHAYPNFRSFRLRLFRSCIGHNFTDSDVPACLPRDEGRSNAGAAQRLIKNRNSLPGTILGRLFSVRHSNAYFAENAATADASSSLMSKTV